MQGLGAAGGQRWDGSVSVPQAGIQNPRVENLALHRNPFVFPSLASQKILYHNSLVLVTERLEEVTESRVELFSFPPK